MRNASEKRFSDAVSSRVGLAGRSAVGGARRGLGEMCWAWYKGARGVAAAGAWTILRRSRAVSAHLLLAQIFTVLHILRM